MKRTGVFLFGIATAGAATLEVADDPALRRALAVAGPGDEIVVKAGVYRGGLHVKGRSGKRDAPIVLRGERNGDVPVFRGGGSSAIQFSGCSHWRVERLAAEDFPGNGFNVDDAGRLEAPSRGMLLKGLRSLRTGPRGNHDGIKLSGLAEFRVEDCEVVGWGGSAIDLVGCRDGVIRGCRLAGAEGFSQQSGIQLKGGTRRVLVERCRFEDAGMRAVNLGGSTGKAYFRPRVSEFEAEDIEVRDCVFEGGGCAVAFVTSRGGRFHHNLVVRPRKWAIRILQEQPVPEFGSCGDGVFAGNLVVLPADNRSAVNIGPDTRPESFAFRDNLWFHEGGRHRPRLPVPEAGGRYGVDPRGPGGSVRAPEGFGPRVSDQGEGAGDGG